MLRTRVIPVLLLRNEGLVKGQRFKNHKYVGDPVNAVRILNEKEVDELVFLDISASTKGGPNFNLLKDIASEAFMPFGYGGGITDVNQIEKLFHLGIEKAIINTSAFYNRQLIADASRVAGAQSIVVSIDVKRTVMGGYEVYVENGSRRTRMNPVEYAKVVEGLGAGEIILCSIDREGTARGYDLKLIESIASVVDIPVIALGGAGVLSHFKEAVAIGCASAVAAGDMFIFHGKRRAVLITYPKYTELTSLFEQEK